MVRTKAAAGREGFASTACRLCLDFANTAHWHASDNPEETLKTYADLATWARERGILTDSETRALRREVQGRPVEGEAALKKAIALREAVYRLFSAFAHGRPPATTDLETLNGVLAETLSHSRLFWTEPKFAWGWKTNGKALDRMLWPVARSAADLLTSEKLSRVGECADERGCGWLFLDLSRNHSRRWCDMKDCGNVAKARRHYGRAKGL